MSERRLARYDACMDHESRPDRPEFTTTHWSLIVAANAEEASQTRARHALAELCETYWYPLYAFARNRGYSSSDAQDLTQSFFAQLIEKGGLASADPDRGRFRSYLLGAMKHFLANEWHRKRALKRGGRTRVIELDALDPEARYALEPAQSADPDAGFDRQWAQQLIGRSLEMLRAESAAAGKLEQFDALKGSLTGEESSRRQTAERLGMSAGAVKVVVHRLRQRYRELVRAEIAKTVVHPTDIDDEMAYLLAALRAKVEE